MKRLILIRHAKSDWTAGMEDHERPLNARGRKAAAAVGEWLRSRHLVPDQALVSSAARTQETWTRLGFDDCPISSLPSLYNAAPEAILAALNKAAKGETCLLIGHNPGIGKFAASVLAEPVYDPDFKRYPTAATTVIECPINSWGDLSLKSGTLAEFLLARSLTD